MSLFKGLSPVAVGVLVVTIWGLLNAAIIFLGPAAGIGDTTLARTQGTIDALVLLFGNWLWGSSRSSQSKDAVIASTTSGEKEKSS